MNPPKHTLTLRFSTVDDQTYRLDLEGPEVGERHAAFVPPYDPATWRAITRALEPGFDLDRADDATRAALEPLGAMARLGQTAGAALADALLADVGIRSDFGTALAVAEGARRPLLVEMQFGQGKIWLPPLAGGD
jgi:hypothetical protein